MPIGGNGIALIGCCGDRHKSDSIWYVDCDGNRAPPQYERAASPWALDEYELRMRGL